MSAREPYRAGNLTHNKIGQSHASFLHFFQYRYRLTADGGLFYSDETYTIKIYRGVNDRTLLATVTPRYVSRTTLVVDEVIIPGGIEGRYIEIWNNKGKGYFWQK